MSQAIFKTADGRWVNGRGEEFIELENGSFEPKAPVAGTAELEAKLAELQAAKLEADANYQRADERVKELEAKLAAFPSDVQAANAETEALKTKLAKLTKENLTTIKGIGETLAGEILKLVQ